jgi:hypothetical protein
MKKDRSMDVKVTLGKLNYRGAVRFLDTAFRITYFFQTLVDRVFHILPLKQTGGTKYISINTHFRVMTTYDKFQNVTNMILQGESHTQGYIQC